jgi:hypothetical protein
VRVRAGTGLRDLEVDSILENEFVCLMYRQCVRLSVTVT